MTDDHELDEHSRELLGKLQELKDLEYQKRHEARSTPEFHALAEDVSAKASEVFRLAVGQEVRGDTDSPRPEEREEQFPGDWTEGDVIPGDDVNRR